MSPRATREDNPWARLCLQSGASSDARSGDTSSPLLATFTAVQGRTCIIYGPCNAPDCAGACKILYNYFSETLPAYADSRLSLTRDKDPLPPLTGRWYGDQGFSASSYICFLRVLLPGYLHVPLLIVDGMTLAYRQQFRQENNIFASQFVFLKFVRSFQEFLNANRYFISFKRALICLQCNPVLTITPPRKYLTVYRVKSCRYIM